MRARGPTERNRPRSCVCHGKITPLDAPCQPPPRVAGLQGLSISVDISRVGVMRTFFIRFWRSLTVFFCLFWKALDSEQGVRPATSAWAGATTPKVRAARRVEDSVGWGLMWIPHSPEC